MSEEKALTLRQREVLLKVAKLNGPEWKTLLDQAWKTGQYFELEGVTLNNCRYLFQLRKKQGTSWLADLKLDMFQDAEAEEKEKLYQKRIELRNLRKAAGLSMAEAARLSGTNYRTWDKWEYARGLKNNPPEEAFTWLKKYMKERRLRENLEEDR